MPETLLGIVPNSLHVGGDYHPLGPTRKHEERVTLLDEFESALISRDENHAPNPSRSTINNNNFKKISADIVCY